MGNNITIFIQYYQSTFKIKISSHNTIKQLKQKIFEKTGIKESSQKLYFEDKELTKAKILHAYKISNNSKIILKDDSLETTKEKDKELKDPNKIIKKDEKEVNKEKKEVKEKEKKEEKEKEMKNIKLKKRKKIYND